jgi:preprotein translocase subunit SecE
VAPFSLLLELWYNNCLMSSFPQLPVIKYFVDVQNELKKVTWPTKQQTLQKTGLVIAVSIVVGAYIGGLDFMFTRLMSLFIK